MRRILVIGALGQIGSELTQALRQRYGAQNVIASDIRMPRAPSDAAIADDPTDAAPQRIGPVDCTRPHQLHEVVRRHDIEIIYHLAA